ncbi:hypothetical protein BD289DRAFT_478646 [Coniella lustricola]|uniref:DNA repair protein Crb2 Tudor domain-containing protein n=1 Tax=Coniella lustricola TaxID=2025994 RepID=A0A2T3AMB4_9PEZI|nr:hypothetical protein BD289DRAFT_478646 [Coniella lustricola]
MSAQLSQLEEEKKQYQEQLDIVHQSLNDEPENAELLGLKAELDEMIKMINESIADIAPAAATKSSHSAAQSTVPTSKSSEVTSQAIAAAPAQPEKWSRENHPAFKKQAQEEKDRAEAATAAAAAAAAAEATPINYAVNDTVLAKWLSGDKGFYPARITAVTGSSTQPIYTVKFKSYDNVETLRGRDIKPATTNKRKADGTMASTAGGSLNSPMTPGTPIGGAAGFPSVGGGSGSTTSNNGIVLTSAPSVYPHVEEQNAAEGADKPVKKFKKIKANKELEKGKNKWQEFNNKGKFGKSQKKDSMFRTPDGVHGRVGFTGSGQAMRKDPTRSRHIYQPNEDVD